MLALKAQQAQACTVTLLGMRAAREDTADHLGAGAAVLLSPVDQAPWRPLKMSSVRRRQVLRQGGVAEAGITSGMSGNTLAAMQDLDAAGGCAHFDLLVHEGLRNAVEVIVDGDVIIDVDARIVVAGELVAADGQSL